MHPLRALPLIAAAALVACASLTADYEARLLDALPQSRGVVIEGQERYPGPVLCGRYTARSFSGYGVATKPFVVTPETVLLNPNREQQAVYCSDEPDAQLFAVTGIGGEGADWSALRTLARDMRAIESAVLTFYNTQQRPPLKLEELLDGAYGVQPVQLTDPWGAAYVFDPGLAGRSLPRIRLSSLGADGVAGGQGPDADVSLDRLALLEHVMRLDGK